MFGPDTCGADKKLHFIMRHKHPKTGVYEEKHSKKPSGGLDFFSDKKTHLFRLTVRPNNEWEVHVDDAVVNSGSLLEDMTPPINPPSEIDDPKDFKPADWDDRQKIPDPDATKPIDWDEDAPEFIVDEEAVKPDGWLDAEPELIDDPEAARPDDWDEVLPSPSPSPSLHLSLSTSLYTSPNLSHYPSLYLSQSLSLHLSIPLPPSLHLSLYLSQSLSPSTSLYLPTLFLPTSLSLSLPLCSFYLSLSLLSVSPPPLCLPSVSPLPLFLPSIAYISSSLQLV